jgi:hypothetical protein
MPWPSLAFKDPRRALLQIGLGVKSIPALVVLDEHGSVITASGVTEILVGADTTTTTSSSSSSSSSLAALMRSELHATDLGEYVEVLQRHPVCVALCNEDDMPTARALMTRAARAAAQPVLVPRGPREGIVHCVLSSTSKMAKAIRGLCEINSDGGDLGVSAGLDVVVLDLAQEQYAHVHVPSMGEGEGEGEMTIAAIQALTSAYKEYSLPLHAIKADAAGEREKQ